MGITNASTFIQTEPELLTTLDELRRREPIFHTPQFGSSVADYALATNPDYWEVGASGRCYSRDFILREMAGKEPVFADSVGWRASDHALRRLGPDTFLLTYTLDQQDRRTRRSTIWERFQDRWRVLYHQGTICLPEAAHPLPEQGAVQPLV